MLKTEPKIFDSFRGGRFTRNNLVKISDDHVLIANQIFFPGDGIAHKRPGYTLVKGGLGFNAVRIFDFRRQSDLQQFVILAGNGTLAWMKSDGSQFTLLSQGEDPNAVWDFATNDFGLYGSNGIKAYRFVDTGNGLLTKFNWGIQAPTNAPTFTFAAGTLNLAQGRQYAYSWVSKWIDALGLQRVHVGPPSPLSGTTGPQLNEVVNLAGLQASADAQVTHLWIWATNDSPLNTTSVLYFLAEIPNGTTAYGDTLPDTSLDSTRQIPYNNFAPPPASIIREFQGRFALSGIAGKPDLVQGTGVEEISLGIPQETAPPSIFFNVPGGIKKVGGVEEFNQNLMVGTEDFWSQVSGLSAETFQENDNILTPGPAGKDLVIKTPTWFAWLSKDKKLWAWNGSSEPFEISFKIARADGSQQLSMESINAAQLASGQLRWFTYGRYSLVILLISSQNNGYFDWFQLWDVSVLSSPAGPFGAVTKDGNLLGAAEGDMFPSDQMIGSGNVQVGNVDYLFLADNQGNIYRWPDGFTDNGKTYGPVIGSEYSDCDRPDFKKRFRWMDCLTSRADAANVFGAAALASNGVMLDRVQPYACPVSPAYAPEGTDPSVFRAKLEQKGTAVGKYLRWFVEFPLDDQDGELYKTSVLFSLVGKDTK